MTKIRQWALRHAAVDAAHVFEELRDRPLDEAARRTGLPLAWAHGVRSFYDGLRDAAGVEVCTGTACTFARPSHTPPAGIREVHCLGRCYEAPSATDRPAAPIPRRSLVPTPVVLRHLVEGVPADPFGDYALPSGEVILDAVEASGLRGRGGAAFPTGRKWRVARDTPAHDRWVVANGDEGDPGAYIDRLLIEESPHAVLAGMLACARAIGAGRGVVFIRREYPEALRRMRAAVAEATSAGHLRGLEVRVVAGAGSYVAGEETALLRAIEGLRAEPSPKPPFPAERGLEGLPTVVQNIETLSVIPWVVHNRRRGDTKAVSLSGAVARTGVVEVALGTPLRRVLDEGGGGPAAGARWKLALVGGPMGRVVPHSAFDVPLAFDALPGMGHAGIVVLDDTASAAELARHLYRFAASESCGTCTPCRVGTAQLATRPDGAALARLCDTLETGSLCGFGQGVPRPLRDLLAHFADELFP